MHHIPIILVLKILAILPTPVLIVRKSISSNLNYNSLNGSFHFERKETSSAKRMNPTNEPEMEVSDSFTYPTHDMDDSYMDLYTEIDWEKRWEEVNDKGRATTSLAIASLIIGTVTLIEQDNSDKNCDNLVRYQADVRIPSLKTKSDYLAESKVKSTQHSMTDNAIMPRIIWTSRKQSDFCFLLEQKRKSSTLAVLGTVLH